MAKKGKPFWAGNQPQAQPQVKKIGPQITVTLNLATKQVLTSCNFHNWDQAISMLIDALRGAQIQKLKEKDQKVVLANPRVIIPGV